MHTETCTENSFAAPSAACSPLRLRKADKFPGEIMLFLALFIRDFRSCHVTRRTMTPED